MAKDVNKILDRKELEKLVEQLAGDFKTFAPVKNEDGHVSFETVDSFDQVSFEQTNSLFPPKELFTPQYETLYSYGENYEIIPANGVTGKMAVLGLRPCDARAVRIHDKVFDKDYRDPYYFSKRNNALLVGLSCNDPGSNCFCTSFEDGGPHSVDALDAMLTQLGEDKWLLQVFNEDHKVMFEGIGMEAGDKELQEKKKLAEEAVKKIKKQLKLPEDLKEQFKDEYWEKASLKCLSCSICRFLCPVCYCFSLVDDGQQRYKYWDNCGLKLFTKEAAGSNPRKEKHTRFRQWYYHKFEYFQKREGEPLCVGCGRCIDNCPVNMDLTEVLENVPQ